MPARFLDTNVLLRYLSADSPDKSQYALSLLSRVEKGEERVETSPLVIFETIFTLQHQYHMPRSQIRDALSDLISLRGMGLQRKVLYLEALDTYAATNLSFADSYNVSYMRSRGIAEIYSWDTDFDRVEGITRFEPS